MDVNQFTEKSQEALGRAQALATRRGHQQVDVEHLFLALLEQQGGLAERILSGLGANPTVSERKARTGAGQRSECGRPRIGAAVSLWPAAVGPR